MLSERGDDRSPENPQYSFERIQLIGDYRLAFSDVASSRGISPAVLNSIEQADCITMLEANSNDEEGDFGLPDSLGSLIETIYPGAVLYPDQVLLVPTGAMIRVELFDDQPDGWRDYNIDRTIPSLDLLAPPRRSIKKTLFNKQVYFDFYKGEYLVGTREADNPRYTEIGGSYVDTEDWQPRKIPNRVLADFVLLPQTLGERVTSRISVYQRTPDDIFPPTESLPLIGRRG